MLVIKNARVFTAAGRNYDKGDIAVENGKIRTKSLSVLFLHFFV